jgi:hypothetical protein
MRPDPEKVLMGVAAALSADLPPAITTPFGVATAGHATLLALVLAQEVDRLADRLHRETLAVKAILRDARPLLDAHLKAEVDAAVSLESPDLKVQSLQTVNDAVRRVLIPVHASVEARASAEARALDARILAELQESTRRRHVVIAGR